MRLLAAFLVAVVLASVASAASPVRSFVRSAGPVDARRTIVLVNGGPGYDSQQIFRAFKRLASPTRRVIAYDQRGIGRTPPPSSIPHDYSLDAFVADLEALRIRLGVQRIDLLGHSFGAFVASAYTAAHPNRPADVSDGAVRGRREVRATTWLAAAPWRLPGSMPALCADRSRALLPVYVGDPRRADAIAKGLGPFRCDDSVGIVANEAIASDPRRPALELALARYRGPALVVMGGRDPFGAAWADDNAAPLRGAQVTKRILPNAGHYLWLESAALYPTLRAFLATS